MIYNDNIFSRGINDHGQSKRLNVCTVPENTDFEFSRKSLCHIV